IIERYYSFIYKGISFITNNKLVLILQDDNRWIQPIACRSHLTCFLYLYSYNTIKKKYITKIRKMGDTVTDASKNLERLSTVSTIPDKKFYYNLLAYTTILKKE
ncbi:hypothetical protein ACJX0J_021074, partial [Zea mays]